MGDCHDTRRAMRWSHRLSGLSAVALPASELLDSDALLLVSLASFVCLVALLQDRIPRIPFLTVGAGGVVGLTLTRASDHDVRVVAVVLTTLLIGAIHLIVGRRLRSGADASLQVEGVAA